MGNNLHIHTIRMYLPILHVADKAAICTLWVHDMVDTGLLYVLNIHTYMHTYIQYSIFYILLCVYCVLFTVSKL